MPYFTGHIQFVFVERIETPTTVFVYVPISLFSNLRLTESKMSSYMSTAVKMG